MYLGSNERGEPICLEADDLLTHSVVLGRTGSGKTGLTIALLEEVSAAGSSAIIFDPKGDLTNMALGLTTEQEFASWVECGVDPAEAYLSHGEGLASFGLGFKQVAAWRRKVDVTIYTPGKSHGGGRSVNVFPTFDPPRCAASPPRERASREVSIVLDAIKHSNDPYDPALIFLVEAVLLHWSQRRSFPVGQWPGILADPPERLHSFGGMKLTEFFPKRSRTKLARALIGFRHQADRWLTGERFDLHSLVSGEKPKLAIFTMRHLSEEDRHFFTGLMMNKVVEFMFETSSSQKLKLLVVLDEARGFLPPHPYNPPTKGPICTILAQGRAQGIGMLLGTQNPVDLDYKALSNVGTWFVGRLRPRDCVRDLESELSNRGIETDAVIDLPQRQFLLLDKRGAHHRLSVRWCYSYLRGPLSAQELVRLPGAREKVPVARLVVRAKKRPTAKPKLSLWGRLFKS